VLDVISKNPGSSSYAHAAGSEVSRYVWVESQTFPSEESDAVAGAESWKSKRKINCEVICIVIHLPSVQAFCERNQSPHCQLGGPVLLI
jgi:hypothetical protein